MDETAEQKSKRLKRERDARYKANKKQRAADELTHKQIEARAKEEAKAAKAALDKAHPKVKAAFEKIQSEARQRADSRQEAKITYTDISGVNAYNVYEDEDEPILKRAPKVTTKPAPKVRAPAAPKVKRRPVAEGIDVTMSRTYQRSAGVAGGTTVRGGSKQLAIMFPEKVFDRVAKLAKKNGVSFAEQVRQFVKAGMA